MPNLTQLAPLQANSRFDVEVITATSPNPNLLRLARQAIQHHEGLKGIFNKAREDKALGRKGRVNRKLFRRELEKVFPPCHLSQDGAALMEVVCYLADEFEQLGDALLLISSDTGKAIARLSDADFYQPNAVPRESGNMIERPVQVRPDVEGFIISWRFDSGRERSVRNDVLTRINQTELLREEGDPRLQSLTRAGRHGLAEEVQRSLPTLLQGSIGVAQRFLTFFAPGRPSGEEGTYAQIKVEAHSRVRRPLQDLSTTNTRYSVLTSTLASVATSWVRSMGGELLRGCPEWRYGMVRGCLAADQDPLDFTGPRTSGLWIAEPNLAVALQQRGCQVLPVIGPSNLALYLHYPVGFLELPNDKFGIRSSEIHDRWLLETGADVTLWVDWSKIEVFSISGDFESGMSVEVL